MPQPNELVWTKAVTCVAHPVVSGFTEMADFFTLNSYVECERTILAKSD
jgi:hypothetical protein